MTDQLTPAYRAALDVAIEDLEAAAQPTRSEVFTACGPHAADLRDAIKAALSIIERGPAPDPVKAEASYRLGAWMSAALDDPKACDELKADIRAWFAAGQPVVVPAPAGEPVKADDQGNHDCLAKRRPGEPMFIILGRDPDGHNIVRQWGERRLAAGGDPEHCQMGLDRAAEMQVYAADPANRPASAPPPATYPPIAPVKADTAADNMAAVIVCLQAARRADNLGDTKACVQAALDFATNDEEALAAGCSLAPPTEGAA